MITSRLGGRSAGTAAITAVHMTSWPTKPRKRSTRFIGAMPHHDSRRRNSARLRVGKESRGSWLKMQGRQARPGANLTRPAVAKRGTLSSKTRHAAPPLFPPHRVARHPVAADRHDFLVLRNAVFVGLELAHQQLRRRDANRL